MSKLGLEIVALLPVPIRATLVSISVLTGILMVIFPALPLTARSNSMPIPEVVQWAYWTLEMSTIVAILFLIVLTLYLLLRLSLLDNRRFPSDATPPGNEPPDDCPASAPQHIGAGNAPTIDASSKTTEVLTAMR